IGIANFKDTERDGQAMARPISRLYKLLVEKELTFGAKVGSGKLAGRAFTSLNDLLGKQTVRDAVESYGKTFEVASGQISTLHAYKNVHDLLHYVEIDYKSLALDARDFSTHGLSRDKMRNHLARFEKHVDNADQIAREPVDRRDRIEKVREELTAVKAAIHHAERELSLESCDRVLILLRLLLERKQSNFNVLINKVASDLDMNSLAEAMQSLQYIISGMDLPSATIDTFQLGVDDLTKLGTELEQRIKEHDNWQQLDDALRTFNLNGSNLLSEVEAFWKILISYVAKAINLPDLGDNVVTTTSDWVDLLIPNDTTDPAALMLRELKKALKRRNLTAASGQLGSLIQHTIQSFDRADKKLLTVCKKIAVVKDPLRTLAENLK
ncbi:MAG TPA: hypothetical protein VK274_09360, partial [Pyrinomonadaceae bacterium]|nr:hypothetical protein [Pyrinomonadaceae bacterium]